MGRARNRVCLSSLHGTLSIAERERERESTAEHAHKVHWRKQQLLLDWGRVKARQQDRREREREAHPS